MNPNVKIALIYLIIGSLWILVSDQLLLSLLNGNIPDTNHLQTVKGLLYVASTAILLYILVSRYYRTIHEKLRELETLNSTLKAQAHKLEATNKDLEQFAQITSHDLQEPLRTITGFLTLLDKKYKTSLDEAAQGYIQFAVDGAERMQKIIQDLLALSRVGRTADQLEQVDLNDMVKEVCTLQSQLINDTRAKIQCHQLPTVTAHRQALEQVFQNLLGNALKYIEKDTPPSVHITATDLGDSWKIIVKDNGIGIHEEYYEKIFLPFQRLHSSSEYTGTGIGLAIVKKIIENQGGHIWVESKPGSGSTFYFTLPK